MGTWSELPALIELELNRDETFLLLCCVRSTDNYWNRKPAEERRNQEAILSILKKLFAVDREYREHPSHSFHTPLTFSAEEQFVIAVSLARVMVDGPIAANVGPAADEYITPHIKMSQLAKHASVIAGLLRRLETAQREAEIGTESEAMSLDGWPTIRLSLNKAEIWLLLSCTQNSENWQNRLPPEERTYLEAIQSTKKKLVTAYGEYCKKPESPYDTRLQFSAEEQREIDASLHMTMADAGGAAREPMSDEDIVPNLKLSQLAKYVPAMADLLRMLRVAQQLTYLQKQVKQLQAEIERLTKSPDADPR